MKVSTATLVLAAALGVAAHPSGFAHKNVHRALEKRLDFVMAKKPVPPPPSPPPPQSTPPPPSPPPPPKAQAPPPPPPAAPVNKAVASPASPPPAAQSQASGGSPKQFCGGNKKRATAAQISYKGNIGSPGDFACNLMMVDKASDYQYTATFENKKGQDQQCAVFLKYGRDGGISGFFEKQEAFKFTLPAGGKKVLAAEANSQGGVSCGVGTVPLTPWGQFAGTWLEFDFANLGNKGYSGADASSLAAADANMAVTAMSVCADGQPCSTIHDGGSGENAYTKGTNALDGVGLNIPPGPVALKVTVG